MSNSDQAKSKLLDSMRMSKQGSTTKKAPMDNSTSAKKTKPAASATKATTSSKKPKASSSQVSSKSQFSNIPVTDDFQAAERVWPD